LIDGTPLINGPQAASPGGSFQPPPTPQYAAPAQKGKSKLPWLIGCAALLVVGIILLGGTIAFLAYLGSKDEARNGKQTISTRSGVKTYTNSRSGLNSKLTEHYTDFSFNYPSSWTIDPEAGKGTSPNFAKVERNIIEDGKEYTLENFAVGWFSGTGSMTGDRPLLPKLVKQLSSQFAGGFPEYEQVSEGETKVGSYDGYEFRFTSTTRGTPKGDVTFWGRVVLIPSGDTSNRNGVALIMLASSLAPEIHGVDDVGVKGEMPVIIETFHLGSRSNAMVRPKIGHSVACIGLR
jgi:hypothetical protein